MSLRLNENPTSPGSDLPVSHHSDNLNKPRLNESPQNPNLGSNRARLSEDYTGFDLAGSGCVRRQYSTAFRTEASHKPLGNEYGIVGRRRRKTSFAVRD